LRIGHLLPQFEVDHYKTYLSFRSLVVGVPAIA
jgi:hypothetical protein